ncbi:hypothetical protein [Rhizobium sp. CF142]|uniref:hypothetical protein n=1 Tax=Rhizobium sp. CF142 TaxID=1144314 RepID=UPI0012F6B510|nr:hypothetical protein [Rhizobium sp. CF142]
MTDKERIANNATVMAEKLKSCIDRLEGNRTINAAKGAGLMPSFAHVDAVCLAILC